jgi:hypothetical protein
MYSYCYVYLFLLFVCFVLYILFSTCQLAFSDYPEVFPCFFLSCKANAGVFLAPFALFLIIELC